jgi:MinD superfamily P-loop ATPase
MRIAVASGKGGTGKTMLATALACVAASRHGLATCYVDCDVEAPNGHLLLHPTIAARRPVIRRVPDVDEGYREGDRETSGVMGHVEVGWAGPVRFVQGTLELGQSRSAPVIEDALREVPPDMDLVVIDAPAGTSSPQVAASAYADLLLLVADATPFARVDLGIILDLIGRRLVVDHAVAINRSDVGDHRLHELCASEGIPVVGTIPWSRTIAQAYARGHLEVIAEGLEDVLASILEHALTVGARPPC